MDQNSTTDLQQWGTANNTIDLAAFVHEKKPPREIHNSLIIGSATDWNYPASSYKCRFDKARFENVSFNNKDFKDCLFDDCEFVNCEITFASIVSSTFRNCIFEKTPFKDEAIHDCLFRTCTFTEASFVGSMIRNSTIEGCYFYTCETSNKVFDACILRENQFELTKLDFRAIRDNFGLSQDQINSKSIRVDRSYPEDETFNLKIEDADIRQYNLDSIDLWKLEYYLRSDLLFYGSIMDNAFNIRFWLKNTQTPTNFIRFLEGFSEFLIHEYQQGRSLYFLIVKLHALTYQLFQKLNLERGFELLLQAVAGIHIRTGNIMSSIDRRILNSSLSQARNIRLRTAEDFLEEEIDDVVKEIRINSPDINYQIIKRNSPVDLLFEIASSNSSIVILSYFILSKTKFEIEKTAKKIDELESGLNKKIFSVNFGLADENTSKQVFSMSSSVPGNYSISLCLSIGTNILKKMRRVLHNLIIEDSR